MPKKHDKDHDEFFEVMPYAPSSHYVYRDDRTDEGPDNTDPAATAKTTAIITLILVAIVTVALGVLFLRGIEMLKDTAPSTSSGSLEL